MGRQICIYSQNTVLKLWGALLVPVLFNSCVVQRNYYCKSSENILLLKLFC